MKTIRFIKPRRSSPCLNCTDNCMGYDFRVGVRDQYNNGVDRMKMDIYPSYLNVGEDPYYKYQIYAPGHDYADDLGYVHFEDPESLEEFTNNEVQRNK